MKLYWPKAMTENGVTLITPDSLPIYDDCVIQIKKWLDDKDRKLVDFWIDVKDTNDPYYYERLDVPMSAVRDSEKEKEGSIRISTGSEDYIPEYMVPKELAENFKHVLRHYEKAYWNGANDIWNALQELYEMTDEQRKKFYEDPEKKGTFGEAFRYGSPDWLLPKIEEYHIRKHLEEETLEIGDEVYYSRLKTTTLVSGKGEGKDTFHIIERNGQVHFSIGRKSLTKTGRSMTTVGRILDWVREG